MDITTLTLLCGIITCGIGICTFVIGMKGRASDNGVMMQKINQAIEGIEELKQDFKLQASLERNLELQVKAHEEQIQQLVKSKESLAETNRILDKIADSLSQINRRNAD